MTTTEANNKEIIGESSNKIFYLKPSNKSDAIRCSPVIQSNDVVAGSDNLRRNRIDSFFKIDGKV